MSSKGFGRVVVTVRASVAGGNIDCGRMRNAPARRRRLRGDCGRLYGLHSRIVRVKVVPTVGS